MRIAPLLLCTSFLAFTSARAADDFAAQSAAHDETMRQKYIAMVEANKEAIVEVEIAWSIKVDVSGKNQDTKEQKIRVNGTVVAENGTVILSLAHSDPTSMILNSGQIPPEMRSQIKIDSSVQSVKIIKADGSEVPAKVKLKDPDLGTMYIVPDKAEKVPFIKIDPANKPELLKSFISFTRLSQQMGRAPYYSLGYVAAGLEKPRRCFMAGGAGAAMPAFDDDGKCIGLFLKPNGLRDLVLVAPKEIADSLAQLAD